MHILYQIYFPLEKTCDCKFYKKKIKKKNEQHMEKYFLKEALSVLLFLRFDRQFFCFLERLSICNLLETTQCDYYCKYFSFISHFLI